MPSITRLAQCLLVLAVAITLTGARGSGDAPVPPPAATGLQEVEVLGVFVGESGGPLVVLQSKRDRRTFGMAIGPAEATGIAVPLAKITPPRPLTHDLFLTLFGRLNVRVDRVVITDLRNDTYFATLHITAGGTAMEMDSRPSDAIALAVRAHAPVFAEERVFDKSSAGPHAPVPPGSRI